ncbi:MAG TPA: class I SAM-dependent methyltransferase [Ktedonobacterales bacterium]|jgi:ubiquinone/menaquinone biosynthesis C-methylase UbiE|nr:class I SAM-dependent methyltransferase [Ktedonobacterales bacterium]
MPSPSWFLDELAHAGGEHLDPRYISRYDRKAGTDPADDLAVLRNLGLNETHTLVDLGAGTGTLALGAARFCRRVVAVDISPAMLAVLRQKAEHLGIANVEYMQGGFLTYEHQGDRADFAYSRHALHHLPDFWKALALVRIAVMLKPGGVLYLRDLVFSFEPGEAEQIIGTWLADAPGQAEQGWTRAELETHLREEYSTFSWLLEPMIERAGFKIQAEQHGESRVHSAYTCVKI